MPQQWHSRQAHVKVVGRRSQGFLHRRMTSFRSVTYILVLVDLLLEAWLMHDGSKSALRTLYGVRPRRSRLSRCDPRQYRDRP